MFVSSYNTYVQTDSSNRESKYKTDKTSSNENSFAQKLIHKTPFTTLSNSSIPVDYISRSQTHQNKQELEYQKEQLKNPDNEGFKNTKETLGRFISHSSLASAQNAYASSTKLYSAFSKTSLTIDQTPKIDKNLPEYAYRAKELSMRHTMVNTYLANEKYYKVTA